MVEVIWVIRRRRTGSSGSPWVVIVPVVLPRLCDVVDTWLMKLLGKQQPIIVNRGGGSKEAKI